MRELLLSSGCRVSVFEPLNKYTSLKLGGPADFLIECREARELEIALEFVREEMVAFAVLGGGTNLLVRDGGFRGIMVKLLGTYQHFSVEGEIIKCGGGADLALAVKAAAHSGLKGLEVLTGIPGTVGGAIWGNAGTKEGEIKDRLISVTYYDEKGKKQTAPAKSLKFGYRASEFKGRDIVIIEAEFQLEKGESTAIKAAGMDILKAKRRTQPLGQPSAGCIFKNPAGAEPAGKLIDDCGLKGAKIGKAEVSTLHANYIINRGDKASDVIELIELIKRTVKERKGVMLEEEVIILGEDL